MSTSAAESDPGAAVAEAVDRRRNFAIISHPDAGKTTLTEKLLLYGGAIQQAGAVKARGEQRKVTSDWMELEKQRGISITSTVLQFDYDATTINLLDTPGHQDFSEDTYRTLAAADNAVMLEDAAKGLEPQTRKLFEVCRMRQIPIFTFINKMDRPGREPLSLLDEIESELELIPWAVNWPIGSGEQFRGVIDRRSRDVVLFARAERGRQASEQRLHLDDPALRDLVEPELLDLAVEEMELLDVAGAELDLEAVHSGDLTPVFFGSAMTNFGVRPFLDAFLEMAQRPMARSSSDGLVDPLLDLLVLFCVGAFFTDMRHQEIAFVFGQRRQERASHRGDGDRNLRPDIDAECHRAGAPAGFQINQIEPVAGAERDRGVHGVRHLLHQGPRALAEIEARQHCVAELQDTGTQLIRAVLVGIRQVAQPGEGIGQARNGRFRKPGALGDLEVAKADIALFEASQHIEAARQCGDETAVLAFVFVDHRGFRRAGHGQNYRFA